MDVWPLMRTSLVFHVLKIVTVLSFKMSTDMYQIPNSLGIYYHENLESHTQYICLYKF